MLLTESNIQNTFSISPFDEYYLPSVNRHMFDTIDSKTQYDKKFKNDFAKEDTLNIVVGMDSGLLVNYLLEQGVPKGSIFIFVELDAVLELLNIDIPKSLSDKLFIYSLEEFQDNFPSVAYGIYILKNNVKHHRSLAATSSHLPEYSIFNRQIIKMLEAEDLEQNQNSSQKVYYKQQFKNISENVQPASLLSNKFNGKTCLVVAGGPSLDDNIDWIKNNHQNLFIIAVSRIAGKLAKEGIPPHIIVSVDPYDFSFEVNRDMMALADSSLFVNSFHVNSRLLGQWQGKNLFMDYKYPWQLEYTDNIDTMGPTVTNASVHLATQMGFSRILLTGVDLCFTDTGFTHSQGSVESKIGPNLGIMGQWIETYGGKKAETVVQLKLAMNALAGEASANPEIEFLNLSLNAAKIKGITHQNVDQIQLSSNACSATQLLESIPDLSIEDRKQDNLLSQKEFSRFYDTLNDIIHLSDEAQDLNKQLKEPKSPTNKTKKNTKRIEAIDKKFNQKYAGVARLIKTYGFSEFSDFLTTKKTDDWDAEHLHQMSHDYYQAFKSIAKQLLELVDDTRTRLDHRLDELSPDAKLIKLVEFWREEEQHGRVNIWLKTHPDWESNEKLSKQPELLKEYKQQLIAVKNEYLEQLAIVPQKYIDTVKDTASMENVFEKIIVLIRDEDHTGLVKMATNLKKLADNDDEAKRLFHLSYSHQLLIEKKESQALEVLLALDEALQSEIELKKITTLALKLGELDIAEKAMSRISDYSDEYMPQHAHVLKLQGRLQESINLYLDYLEKYPSDVTTWLKFGSFMFDIDQIQAAIDAFSHVIQSDPDNQVALSYLSRIETALNASQDT
ncbi:protein of unknown function DUF115 [Shewanella sediminis HAW-EB3]|uniref:6-hydroxymethylpterin diphosphokinase MptE-like domain-containing protein n=1 Tax=Shewanella sediminis (strain HAW-EB3) TaxID=425104 RepID=A8FXY8_SHESH|nr:6-hydroxymethylpterin diphosphokinase MptE-like protein [Shewanella sediminis]ABV37711.1 protein of unknown function DUF115 [Shewanella sediminis HAW-EB3]